MANTYTWRFTQLDAKPALDGLADVVSTVHWTFTADDNAGHSAVVGGNFDTPLETGAPFVAFAELTQAVVQDWAEAKLPVADLKELLDRQITAQVAPATVSLSPPWITP